MNDNNTPELEPLGKGWNRRINTRLFDLSELTPYIVVLALCLDEKPMTVEFFTVMAN